MREIARIWKGGCIIRARLLDTLMHAFEYRTARLPQNLTQAQRDFFGAHTYQRVDRPDAGFVHTDWPNTLEESAKRRAP